MLICKRFLVSILLRFFFHLQSHHEAKTRDCNCICLKTFYNDIRNLRMITNNCTVEFVIGPYCLSALRKTNICASSLLSQQKSNPGYGVFSL